MKTQGTGWIRSAAVSCAAAVLLFAGTPHADDEPSFWDRFKTLFVEWDDQAPEGSARTEVTGVRGLDVEGALGSDKYDWTAVDYMERYYVSMEDEAKFLQEGGLGPYRGSGK